MVWLAELPSGKGRAGEGEQCETSSLSHAAMLFGLFIKACEDQKKKREMNWMHVNY